MRVAWAAAAEATDLDTEGPLLRAAAVAAGLDEHVAVWDDPSVDWSSFDLVVIRATWDYFRRPGEFLHWADHVATVSRLRNDAEVVRWNLDKRYLGELAAAGLPVVPTQFASAAAELADLDLDGDRVVKPTVSAGSNDTMRSHDSAASLAAATALVESGRTAMVQPYVPDVDVTGERGIVAVAGTIDHAFTKAPLLAAGGAAEVDGLFAIEEITPVELRDAEVAVAEAVLAWVAERFGPQLYARVDLVETDDGPALLELELIEPGLFFQVDPPSAGRFVEAVTALA